MESHLKWPDYLILVGFLVISLAIGIYHSMTGGRQKTTNEFIMGNRRLKVIPTAISLLMTYRSAVLLIGLTTEIYSNGIQYVIFFILSAVVALVFNQFIIVPWLYPLKLVSIYDYLEMRYMSKSIRIFGASIGISTGILFMGVIMYAPSAALESATGLPISVSIPAMAIVTVAYTALGGMRAVIWTDVFQFLVMIGGMVAIIVKGLMLVGGITDAFRLAGEEGRLVYANVSFDPRERNTVWSLMIGMGVYWVNAFGLTQSAVQRYCAVDKLSKAKTTMLIIIPPLIVIDVMAGIIGLIVLAYYASIKCDPLANKDIASHNMLLPYFVVNIFTDSPGFAGLYLATLYGGTLSSVSSILSGSSANFWEDILKWKLSHLTEARKTLIIKFLVVLFGALSTGVAFLSSALPGSIIQVLLSLFSSTGGPLVAFFVLGAVSRHANWKGALIGGIVGVSFTIWLTIGSMSVSHAQPRLPPVSVENCSNGDSNSTLIASSVKYTKYANDGISDINSSWNQTTPFPSEAESQMTQLRGLENFYAISHLWFMLIGIIVTGVVGIIASLIMRDRELEKRVDACLLMRFRGCRWSDENENQEHVEDGNKASLRETEDLVKHDDDFLNSVGLTASNKTVNELPNGK